MSNATNVASIDAQQRQFGLINSSLVFNFDSPMVDHNGDELKLFSANKPAKNAREFVVQPIINNKVAMQVSMAFLLPRAGEVNNVMLEGPPGCGKTMLASWLMSKLNLDPVFVSSSDETEVSDLIGKYVPQKDGSFKFVYGPLSIAVLESRPLIWDEYDKMRAGVVSKFNALFEGYDYVIEETGEVLRPNQDPKDGLFCIVGTANTKLHGDMTGKFGAAQVGDRANARRFNWIHMDYEIATDQMLMSNVIKDLDLVGLMSRLTDACRNQIQSVDFGHALTKQWAEYSSVMPMNDALMFVYGNQIDSKAELSFLSKTYKDLFGKDLITDSSK